MKTRILLVILASLSFVGGVQKTLSQVAQAEVGERTLIFTFQQIVKAHPSAEIRGLLSICINYGQVEIDVADNSGSPLIQAQLRQGIPVLMINPGFLKPIVAEPAKDMAIKQFFIRHEGQHILDHIQDRLSLSLPSGDVAANAAKIWAREYSAQKKDWVFARANALEELMPEVAREIGKNGVARGLLEGFYQSLKKGSDPDSLKKYLPHWEKLYEQEKKRILLNPTAPTNDRRSFFDAKKTCQCSAGLTIRVSRRH